MCWNEAAGRAKSLLASSRIIPPRQRFCRRHLGPKKYYDSSEAVKATALRFGLG